MVVVSHQPGEWLARCLSSIIEQADEVIVVDNGSDGSSATRVAAEAGARPVRSDRNRGFADGVNLGLSLARGDVIALLNDDAVAEGNWIEASLTQLEAAGVAAVVPKLLLAHPYAEIRLDDVPYRVDGDPRPLGRRLHSLTVDGSDRLGGCARTGPSSGGNRAAGPPPLAVDGRAAADLRAASRRGHSLDLLQR